MWPRSSGCAPRGFALQPGAPSVPGASFTTRVCGDLRTRTVLAFRRQMTLSRRLHDVAVALHASPEVSDRWVLIGVVVVFWNFLIVTLAILAEIPSERSRKTLALAVDEAEGPVPSLIPSWQELGFGRESKPEEKRPWSPSKDDLDEGLLRSEGLEATLAFDSIASSSQSLVVFGSLLPRHAEVTLTLLQRFLPTEEEKRFGQKAVMFLATQSNAEDEKFWKRKAAHLLTLARLGADCGTLLAGLLDPEPGQDVDGLMQFLHGHPIGREVAHLLQERKAIGDLVTLFDLRAQQDDLGRAGGALDTWPASAQLCHQLFVQSCRDSRPVLVELMLDEAPPKPPPRQRRPPTLKGAESDTGVSASAPTDRPELASLHALRAVLAASQADILQRLDSEIIRLMKMFDGVDALVQPTGVQGAPVKAPARREAVDIPDGPCDMLEDGSEGEAFVQSVAMGDSARDMLRKYMAKGRSSSMQETGTGPIAIVRRSRRAMSMDQKPSVTLPNQPEEELSSGDADLPELQRRTASKPTDYLPSLSVKRRAGNWFKLQPKMPTDKRMGKSKTMKAKAKAETVNNGTPSKTTPEKRTKTRQSSVSDATACVPTPRAAGDTQKSPGAEESRAIQEMGPGIFGRMHSEFSVESLQRYALEGMGHESAENRCTDIVSHPMFERFMMLIVGLNVIELAVSVEFDYNASNPTLHSCLVIIENIFCGIFTVEIILRSFTYKRFLHLLQDGWFLFDFLLVLLMIWESWVMPFLTASGPIHASFESSGAWRMARIFRVLRTARMARLVRLLPELMILIKGMLVACRSVFFTLLLLLIITFVFSIAFLELGRGTDLESEFFPSILSSVVTLILHCIVPDQEVFFRIVAQDNPGLGLLVLLFILLGSLTVMNMLLGVLVEAVKTVSTIEREQMVADFARRVLWQLIQSDKEDPDEDDYCDRMISEKEFKSLLRKPKAVKALAKLGVDASSAVDYGKMLFEDDGSVSFMDFMRAMLALRGSNKTTVKDMVELRKYVGEEFADMRRLFSELCSSLAPRDICTTSSLKTTSRALRLVEEHSPKDALAAVALARSALDFHAPVARSLGYDLPVDPNAVGLLPIPHCETLPATLEHFGLLLRYPSEYRLVLDWFDRQFGFLDRILTHGIRVVKVALHQNRGFQALGSGYKVKSRMKSPQSLMKKLLQGRRVNDLLGLEVIVQPRHLLSGKGEATAFAAASAILKYVSSVEAGWKIAPNSFKDYVSKPKKSGYQAIHLTLVTDFQANTLSVRHQSQAPCQLELHIFTTQMKLRERQGPASHATYKSFPLCPEDLMEKLGNEGVVSISEVAHHDFDADASQKLEELAQRAGYQDMDIEDLRLSRAHVNKVVSAFQELMAAETTSTLPLGDETDAASLPDGYLLGPLSFVHLSVSRSTVAPGRRTSLIRRARGGEGDALAVGDTVSALCPDDSQWYPGAIEKINDDGTFSVKWDDPDGGPETHDIEVADIQKIVIFKDYKVGERVEAIFPDDGYWYPAEVTKVGDGRFTVKWDDPDGGPEESEVDAKEMKYPPIPYGDIEIGKKYDGTVRSVLDFGAFVDIGAESEGLLHISRISGERVENIYDVLSEGQKVEVWVSGKREDEEKFGLTMVEGKMDSAPRAPADLTPFADLPSDEWYNGKVARTAPFGAFVTVTLDSGAQADGLVHVSKIKDGFVDNVDDEVSIGQDVKVRIEDVDLDSNRMRLSMREGGFGGGPRAPVDLTPFESISPDNWLKGKVARLAPFGAFVTVTTPDGDATADGLVHITQIRDGFVESVEDELQVGQEVEVRVESANNEDGKMSLSMKQPF
ncbi:unnamed protein product [Durusdinium trenchii]|uniref:Uncharacterized protein n=1 Tax=Durusdinium trenchii TaxID=1381693 RepID=A0ABP0S0Q4_9DINO